MKTTVLLFACLLASSLAHAEIACGHTAEWLAHQSTLIVLATPIEVENIKGPGEVWITRTRFRLDEVLKGPESKGDTVTIYDFSHKTADTASLKKAKAQSKQLLVFAIVAEHMFKRIDGKYVFTRPRRAQFKSAYYTDRPVTKLFTPEFGLLTDFNKLLRRTRKQVTYEADFIRTYLKGKIERKSLEVPFGSEAYRHLYRGSACYVWVPDYKKQK